MFVDSIVMGINLWFAPQISEHWPINRPGFLIIIEIWFSRPGTASIFTPSDGIVHEWITSDDETIIRVCVSAGNINRLSVSISRIIFFLFFFIYDSNSIFVLSEYSYDQYHWCPIAFTVIDGLIISSIRYRIFNDGKAIIINKIAGIIVQIVSVNWFSSRFRFDNLFIMVDAIIIITAVVIDKMIIMVWSWKKISCSIIGLALFNILIFVHDGIFKEVLFIYEF